MSSSFSPVEHPTAPPSDAPAQAQTLDSNTNSSYGADWASAVMYLPSMCWLVIFAALCSTGDPDLGYHLAIGSFILQQWSFPSHDLFRINSFEPEIAYSWLPDVTLAWAERLGGVLGLRIWLLLSVLVLSLAVISLVIGRMRPVRASLLLLVTSLCLFQVSSPRPRIWATILFAVLLGVLRDDPQRRLRFLRQALLISAITVVWANSHISVVLAPCVVALYGLGCWVQGSSFYTWRRVFALSGVSLFSIMLNPYGLKLFGLLSSFSPQGQRAVSDAIVELQGFTELVPSKTVWVWAGLVLGSLWLIITVQRFFCLLKSSNRPSDSKRSFSRTIPPLYPSIAVTLIALVFLAAALQASRHFNLFAVAAVFAIASSRYQRVRASSAELLVAIGVSLLAVSAGFSQATWPGAWFAFEKTPIQFPSEALEGTLPLLEAHTRTAAHDSRLTILTHFNHGHFTNWWLYRHQLLQKAGTVIDGRTDKLGISRFFSVFEVFHGQCVEQTLEQLDVKIAIVPQSEELFDILDQHPEWIALAGSESVSFVRKELLETLP